MRTQNIKKSLTILFLICYSTVFSQINDGFYHHFFTINPVWGGDTAAFYINKTTQLQTKTCKIAQTVALSAPNNLALDVQWEFYIHLNFNPSPRNQVRIYLIADNQDLKFPLNGYFLQLGENGSEDSFDLFLQRGTKNKKIIDGPAKIRAHSDQFIARVLVKRNATGLWELKTDYTGGRNFISEGTTHDATLLTTTWVGIHCKYTPSHSNGFIFSDFKVSPLNINENSSENQINETVINDVLANDSSAITPNDILISEILFNPHKLGADFVEIYNNSNRVLNLQELSLATMSNAKLNKLYPISDKPLLFHPKEYLALTTQPQTIQLEYHIANSNTLFKTDALPALNNIAGTVVLLSQGNTIDQLDYAETMHAKFIKNRKGVSLERSSLTQPTNQPGNFRSSASRAGFATPGYANSQTVEGSDGKTGFSLESKTFSPNEDGFEDVLQIRYKLEKADTLTTIRIYNDQGLLIKTLVSNETLATQGTLHWDGLNDRNELAKAGIYIIHSEQTDIHGDTKKERMYCALVHPLN